MTERTTRSTSWEPSLKKNVDDLGSDNSVIQAARSNLDEMCCLVNTHGQNYNKGTGKTFYPEGPIAIPRSSSLIATVRVLGSAHYS